MPLFMLRPAVTVLLIAILASGALSAPAWRHSHVLTEHATAQREADHHSHRHAHAHSHSHSHRHAVDETEGIGEPPVEHLHVVWFGFPLTLPVSPDDSSDRANMPGEWVPLLAEMLPPQIVAADALGLGMLDAADMAFSVETPPLTEPFVPPKISRLCDTARRERSGVLVI